MIDITKKISDELSLKEFQVHNTIELLLKEECSVPFIARYRKEKTGTLDEVQIRAIRDRHIYLAELEANKVKYLKVVEEHCDKRPEFKGRLPELRRKFEACTTKQELEDLYLPFKPKRRTRAQIAKEKGLEPLANKLLEHIETIAQPEVEAQSFVTVDDVAVPAELKVKTVEEALAGASDILSERFAETATYRALVRSVSFETGQLTAKQVENLKAKDGKDQKKLNAKAAKFQNYYDYSEPLAKAMGHRIMAVRRGEAEKVLRVNIDVDTERALAELTVAVVGVKVPTAAMGIWIKGTIADCYKRLLSPAIETEMRLDLKARAEEEAIRVFSKNLESLLLLPPVTDQVIMGIDPGIRTGSKLAVVDGTGKLVKFETVYPQHDKPNSPKNDAARETIRKFIVDLKVNYIAVGNGTGGREINRMVVDVIKKNDIKNVKRLFVNEAGASVYSTDAIAREEFPDLDPTIRSTISIARRLQDPLAELVKIDPRSIGVGQYQHDVNVTKLKRSLEDVVESCVNRVGVNLNSASYALLSYVSGVGLALAKSIVKHRDQNGEFNSRTGLEKVSGFGPRAFTQCAGFLRVPNSTNPLDNSSVHPESYGIVQQIALDQKKDLKDIVGNAGLVNSIPLEKYVTEEVGMPTLQDISAELIKPGRDPRDDSTRLSFSEDITELEDLKVDMKLQGTVSNVTNFGAFVDIGVHQDGLVHISELSSEFIKDPSLIVSVGDILSVRVMEVDLERKRISLSCKPKGESPATAAPRSKQAPGDRAKGQNRPPRQGANKNRQDKRPHQQRKGGQNRKPAKEFTMDDLLKKFNQGN